MDPGVGIFGVSCVEDEPFSVWFMTFALGYFAVLNRIKHCSFTYLLPAEHLSKITEFSRKFASFSNSSLCDSNKNSILGCYG